MKNRYSRIATLLIILLGLSSFSFYRHGGCYGGSGNYVCTEIMKPEFNVYLGEQLIYGQKVDHGKVRDATRLHVRDLDGKEYTVWSYKLNIMLRGSGGFYEATHVDPEISAREREVMQGLETGDFIQITGIEVVNPAGGNHKVEDAHCNLQ